MAFQIPPASSSSNRPQSAQPATVAIVDDFITRLQQGMSAAGNQNMPVFQQLTQIKASVDAGQLKPGDALNKIMTLMMVLPPKPGATRPSHTVPVQPQPVGTGYTNTSGFTPPSATPPPPVTLTPPPAQSTPKSPGSEPPTFPASSFKRNLTR